MIQFFERKRLVRKGLASAKIRRRRTRSEFACTLETGLWVKGGIFSLFCLGLACLIFYGAPANSTASTGADPFMNETISTRRTL